jgi:hypothetical protein
MRRRPRSRKPARAVTNIAKTPLPVVRISTANGAFSVEPESRRQRAE